MTLVVAARNKQGLAISADTLALTKEDGAWARLPPMGKLFRAGSAIFGAAVNGVRGDPTPALRAIGSSFEPTDSLASIAEELSQYRDGRRISATFLVAGFDGTAPRILRVPFKGDPVEVEAGYATIGDAARVGDLDPVVRTLYDLAEFTKETVASAAREAIEAGDDPPMVSMPADTWTIDVATRIPSFAGRSG